MMANKEERMMGDVMDFLRGFTPQVNEDSQGFPVIEGVCVTKVNYLRPEKDRDGVVNRYRRELEVIEVLSGNGQVGRKLWTTFYQDNEESVKKLVNDCFTSGITLNLASKEAMEASFEETIGKKVYVRCWGWTPEKKQDGTPIPVDEREAKQQFIVKTDKAAMADAKKGGKSSTNKSSVPF